MAHLSTLNTPRTVAQLRALETNINTYDARLDKAVNCGNKTAAIKYDALLTEAQLIMAKVSDALWGRYCETLMEEL